MRIVPVMDVMNGQVVRAIGGRRDEYRPLDPFLFGSNDPLTVAAGMTRRAKSSELYIADLDAIVGGPFMFELSRLRAAGMSIWLDRGVRHAEDALDVVQRGADRVILGSETVTGPDVVARVVATLSPESVLFSLDLHGGVPLIASDAWSRADPLEIVTEVVNLGIEQIIVLDLAAVGERAGPGTERLCEQIHTRFPDLGLIIGGGVRHWGDLDRFGALGVEAALVGSALHDGSLYNGAK